MSKDIEVTPTIVTKICKIIQQDYKKYLPNLSTKDDLDAMKTKESTFGRNKD